MVWTKIVRPAVVFAALLAVSPALAQNVVGPPGYEQVRKMAVPVVCLSHSFSSFAGVLNRLTREDDLPEKEGYADDTGDDAPLSPIRRFFSGSRSAPLSAQIAFSFALWILAGGALHHGLGDIGDGRRRIWPISLAVLVGLIPFLLFWL